MNACAHSSLRRRAARGFTLIEVLIAVLIFSVGILGTLGMQVRLAQATVQNGDRARASMLADEVASQMWLKRSADIANADSAFYTAWKTRVATPATSGLPQGGGVVSYATSTKISTITITWTPTNQTSSHSFVTSVVIP
jgi:type IV pilus assembly protein PilV